MLFVQMLSYNVECLDSITSFIFSDTSKVNVRDLTILHIFFDTRKILLNLRHEKDWKHNHGFKI